MLVRDIIRGGTTKEVLSFLEKSPVDELYTIQELNEKFGVPESTIKSSQTLRPYRTNFLGKNYFGSKSAIEGFEKKLAEGE
jgi:hypothetical protein